MMKKKFTQCVRRSQIGNPLSAVANPGENVLSGGSVGKPTTAHWILATTIANTKGSARTMSVLRPILISRLFLSTLSFTASHAAGYDLFRPGPKSWFRQSTKRAVRPYSDAASSNE